MTEEQQMWSDDAFPWVNVNLNANSQLGIAARVLARWPQDWYKESYIDPHDHERAYDSIQDLADTITSQCARIAELEAQNARFVGRIAELVAAVGLLEAAQDWERVPDGEYPMVEGAEMDGDFLYVSGNENDDSCTWVERPTETIMLDLPMKIFRRRKQGSNDEQG